MMLTFSVVPQTLLVKGFQPTVNQTEKPSPQSPTQTIHPLTADSFTPSASNVRSGHWFGDVFKSSEINPPVISEAERLELNLQGTIVEFTNAITALKDSDLIKILTEGEHPRALEAWIKNKETNPRASIEDRDLDFSFGALEQLITSSVTKRKKKELLKLLNHLKAAVDAIRSLPAE